MSRNVSICFILFVSIFSAVSGCGPTPSTDGPTTRQGNGTPFEPGETIVEIGGNPQLFLDNLLIASSSNVKKVFHPPQKHPDNPLMTQEHPWEERYLQIYGTVLYDGETDRFRMWYMSSASIDAAPESLVCYAESEDGVHWTKPMVGPSPWNGHDRNNIVLFGGHGICVMRDDSDPNPDRRYKGLGGEILAVSPDGVNWATQTFVGSGKNDTGSSFVRWNNRYMAYLRTQAYINDDLRAFIRNHISEINIIRECALSVSRDFNNWSLKDTVLTVYEDLDQYPWTQPYGMAVTAYGDQLIALVWFIDLDPVKGNYRHGDMFTRMAVSRDGEKWSWVSEDRFLEQVPGTWEAGRAFPGTTLVRKDGTVYLYYSGNTARHSLDSFHEAGIGLATWPEDRFVSLEPANSAEEAVAETPPLLFGGDDLVLNADMMDGGSIQVALVNRSGGVVNGFEPDASHVESVDDRHFRVRWKSASGELRLADAVDYAPLSLRVILRNARLFAFQASGASKAVRTRIAHPEMAVIPMTAEDYFEKGLLRYRKAQFESAESYFNRAVELNPNYALALSYRGVNRLRLHHRDRAVDDCRLALEMDPDNPEILFHNAVLLIRAGENQKGLEILSRAVELDPDNLGYRGDRGLMLSALGRFDEAIRDFDFVLEAMPDEPYALADRGYARMSSGRYADAVVDFSNAMETFSDNPMLIYNRGLAYSSLGQMENAAADFNKALELTPDDETVRFFRGTVYQALGEFEKALQDFDAALEQTPENVQIHYHRGIVNGGLQNYGDAAEDFTKAIELGVRNIYAYFYRGISHHMLGQVEPAMDDYNEALRINAGFAEARVQRGWLNLSIGEYARAVEDFKFALETDPENIHLALAQAYNDWAASLEEGNRRGERIEEGLRHLLGAVEAAGGLREEWLSNPSLNLVLAHPTIRQAINQ